MKNSKIFIKILDNVSNYQKLISFNLQKDKVALKHYKIPTGYEGQYLKDIEFLVGFDKNLLWDREFWGIKSASDSISAIAVPTRNSLKYILKFAASQ